MISILISLALLALIVFVGIKYVDPVVDRVKGHAQKVVVHYASMDHWTLGILLISLAADLVIMYMWHESSIILIIGICSCIAALWQIAVVIERMRRPSAD